MWNARRWTWPPMVAAALMIAAGSAGAAEPVDLGIPAGPARFYPAVSLIERYDDNIFLTDTATQSSLITILAPQALWELDGETRTFRLEMGLERGWYHDSPADNYLDRHLGVGAEFDPSPRFLAGATLDYNYGHESRGTGANEGAAATAFASPDEFSLVTLGGRVRYGIPQERGAPVLEVSGAYLSRDYQNNRASTQFRDRDEARVTALFSYFLSPVTALLVEGRVHRFDYDLGTNDNTEYSLLTGASWEVTNITTGFAKVGWKRKEFSDAAFDSSSNVFWELGVRWKPLTYSVFGLAASRETLESNGTGDYIDSRAVKLTWDHDWHTYLSSEMAVNLARQDYPGAARQDDVADASFVLRYLSRWWLTLEAGYAYATRDSNTAGLDYTDNRFSLGIKVAL